MPPPVCRFFMSGWCQNGERCTFLHPQQGPEPPLKRCYTCREPGHISRECPLRTHLICDFCRSTRHSTNDCCSQFQRLETAPGYIVQRTALPSLATDPGSPLEHDPTTYLEHARHFLKQKKPDLAQTCEKVWGCSSLALHRVGGLSGVRLHGHDAKSLFVEFIVERGLVDNTKNWFVRAWNAAQWCHMYFWGGGTERPRLEMVQQSVQAIAEFSNAIAGVRLSDDDRIALKQFYERKKQQRDPRASKKDLVIVD